MAREVDRWWSEPVSLAEWVEEGWRAGNPRASSEAVAAHVLTLTVQHPGWPWSAVRSRRQWAAWQERSGW